MFDEEDTAELYSDDKEEFEKNELANDREDEEFDAEDSQDALLDILNEDVDLDL